MMKTLIKKSIEKTLNIFYPNQCLHCSNKLEKNYFYFCKNCLNDFSYLEIQKNKNVSTFAVFENMGAIKTLLKELKNQKILSITKIAASFIVNQISNLNWPMPDVIYPISNPIIKDPLYYLAKEVSGFFNVPIKRKQDSSKIALIVFDVINIENLNQIKEKLSFKKQSFKKVYAIGLCFDVFFDDLDLPL